MNVRKNACQVQDTSNIRIIQQYLVNWRDKSYVSMYLFIYLCDFIVNSRVSSTIFYSKLNEFNQFQIFLMYLNLIKNESYKKNVILV